MGLLGVLRDHPLAQPSEGASSMLARPAKVAGGVLSVSLGPARPLPAPAAAPAAGAALGGAAPPPPGLTEGPDALMPPASELETAAPGAFADAAIKKEYAKLEWVEVDGAVNVAREEALRLLRIHGQAVFGPASGDEWQEKPALASEGKVLKRTRRFRWDLHCAYHTTPGAMCPYAVRLECDAERKLWTLTKGMRADFDHAAQHKLAVRSKKNGKPFGLHQAVRLFLDSPQCAGKAVKQVNLLVYNKFGGQSPQQLKAINEYQKTRGKRERAALKARAVQRGDQAPGTTAASQMTLGAVRGFVQAHEKPERWKTEVPSEHLAYVLDGAIVQEQENGEAKPKIVIVIATENTILNLVRNHVDVLPDKICIDGTYRLMQEGFGCFPVGVSDRNQRMHLVAHIVLSMEETQSFADAFGMIKRELRAILLERRRCECPL